MEERRGARIGTVSGLALLAGGTAVAAVAGGSHSIFATVLLGLLAIGMGHSLLIEIRRQAHRRVHHWARADWVNTMLLGCWAATAFLVTLLGSTPREIRAVAAALTVGYAVACGYFVTHRRRVISDRSTAQAARAVAARAEPAMAAPAMAAPGQR